jgi:hypothetical protein
MSDASNAWHVIAHEAISEPSKTNGHGPDDAQKWGMAAIGAAHAANEAARAIAQVGEDIQKEVKQAIAEAVKAADETTRQAIAGELTKIYDNFQRMVIEHVAAHEKSMTEIAKAGTGAKKTLDDQAQALQRTTEAAARAETALRDTRALLDGFGKISKVLEAAAGALSQSVAGRKRIVRDKDNRIIGIEPVERPK